MDTRELTGKTIARVVESNYDEWGQSLGLILWFTDGTAVRVEPTGWEVDGIELQTTTPEQLDADWTENIQSEIDRAWKDHLRALAKHVEVEKMRAAYGHDVAGFQRWYEERFGLKGFAKVLKTEYQEAIREQARQSNRLLWSFERGDHA
jgi:hypothetical protein